MIGIDFGTTNSCVAIREAFGDVKALPVATGPRPPYDTVLRTAVLNPAGPSTVIGQEAVNTARQRLADDDVFLEAFKPYLDDQKLRTAVRKELRIGSVYDPMMESQVDKTAVQMLWEGGLYTRPDLIGAVAHIYSHLLQQALANGAELDQIWLGMPVNFTSCARKRLVCGLAEARDESGDPLFDGYRDVLNRVRFVLEPVTVAAQPLGQALDVADRENVLVFDHGGGTLDLSLIAFERRPEFEHPVPVRELAAGGSAEMAGRALDLHFREYLETVPAFREATAGRRAHAVDSYVEECKQALSTEPSAEAWPEVEVEREEFERAIEPVLVKIERLVRKTTSLGGLEPHQVDRVVMTGGSSLVPAVQRRVRSIFTHLDEYRFLRYDPSDRAGVEDAITEVAKGLVHFGDRVATQGFFEQVVLWDVEVAVGGQRGFRTVVPRGTPYKRNGGGSPELEVEVPLDPCPGQGTCVGVYENQLGHRFLFGLADLPQLPHGGEVRLLLRPESLLPSLHVTDHTGRVALREIRVSDDKTEWLARCDVLAMSDEALEDYFGEDAEYHPIHGYRSFETAPLVRRLRVGDLVEWCIDVDGEGPGRKLHRCRGEVRKIRDIESGEYVDEMTTWILEDYIFDLREEGKGTTNRLKGRTGSIRLSPRPWRDF